MLIIHRIVSISTWIVVNTSWKYQSVKEIIMRGDTQSSTQNLTHLKQNNVNTAQIQIHSILKMLIFGDALFWLTWQRKKNFVGPGYINSPHLKLKSNFFLGFFTRESSHTNQKKFLSERQSFTSLVFLTAKCKYF